MLKEAYLMIERYGSEDLSVRKLSKQVGVSHNALYKHFKSKDDLLQGVAEAAYIKLGDIYEAISCQEELEAFERLKKCTYAYVKFVVENPNIYRTMVSTKISGMEKSESFTSAVKRTYHTLLDLAQRAQENGQIKTSNITSVVNTAWAIGHGIAWLIIDEQFAYSQDLTALPTVLLSSSSVPDDAELDEVIRYSLETFFNGVRVTI